MTPRITVMGTSLGGLKALRVVLGGLPKDFPVPIAIVQHRSNESDDGLCVLLQEACALRIGEAQDKEPILPGHAYLAPPNYHLLVEGDAFALSTEAPVCHARPSVDVLFESAAEAYGAGVVGVILTGVNEDGRRGLQRDQDLAPV